MNVLLWVLQVLLAAAFLAHGLLLLMPPPDIAAQMLVSFPRAFWLFLGLAEVAAAIGLTLPGFTRVMPFLGVDECCRLSARVPPIERRECAHAYEPPQRPRRL